MERTRSGIFLPFAAAARRLALEEAGMLHVPVGANTYGLTLPSWGTTRPAAANGTAVTPGTGSEGSWAQLGSDLADDAFGILININSNSASSASRNTVVDIGIDEAGGTSYTERISNLLCGGAPAYSAGGSGAWYYFPLFIPAGSAVAARGQGTVATAFRVGAMFMQRPANPSMIRKGSFVETLGISGTAGTSITVGTTSDGSWTSVGTLTNRCWWWQVGYQVSSADTSWAGNAIHLDVGVGDGSGGGTVTVIQDLVVATLTSEQMSNPPLTAGVEFDVPAGTGVYVRAQASGTGDACTMAVYALGG
jgi:hypothetical protein